MKKALLLVALLAAGAFLHAKTITIYHTSDVHGFFYPQNGQGGAAALASVMEHGPHPYLLFDGGDFASGTIETNNSQGIKAVELMNRLGYRAATIGNHEFDHGEDGFQQMLEKARFNILAANLQSMGVKSSLQPKILPYQIFKIDGVSVAVIGLANTSSMRRVTKYFSLDPLLMLKLMLKQPAVRQAQVVVVLVHDSIADDLRQMPFYVGEIGRRFSGKVHLVLGGHAHKTFSNYYVKKVLFVESGAYLKSVAKISVQINDKTGRFVSAVSQIVPLVTEQTGEDLQIAAYAESLKEPGMDEVLGRAEQTLTLADLTQVEKDGQAENWVADVLRAYTGSDVFVHNSFGVRTPLFAGEVTKRALFSFFPFDDHIVKMQMKGKILKKLVLSSLVPRNLLSYSGMQISYRVDKKGQLKETNIWVQGEPLQENKIYKVAVNTYLTDKSQQRQIFQEIPPQFEMVLSDKTIRQVLEETLRKGPISAPATGRVIQFN